MHKGICSPVEEYSSQALEETLMSRVLPLGLLFSWVVLISLRNSEAAFISVGNDAQAAMSAKAGTVIPDTDSEGNVEGKCLTEQNCQMSLGAVALSLRLVERFSQPSLMGEINAADGFSRSTSDGLKHPANFSPVGIMVAQAAVGIVPEPSSIILAAFGLVGLIALGWRRNQRNPRASSVQ